MYVLKCGWILQLVSLNSELIDILLMTTFYYTFWKTDILLAYLLLILMLRII